MCLIHNQYILDIIENGYEWLKYAVLKQNQHKCIFIAINHHLRTKIVLLPDFKSELKIKSPTSNLSLAILPSSYLNLY
jgi:hypothetical protein